MREVGNGRYQLVRELGRGGMGAVWLGQDTVLGRAVAVKELLMAARLGVPVQLAAVTTLVDVLAQYEQPGWTVIAGDLLGLPWTTDQYARKSHGTWGRHDECGRIQVMSRGRDECVACPPEPGSRTHRARAGDRHLLYLVRYRNFVKFGRGYHGRVHHHLRLGAIPVQVLTARHAEVHAAELALKRRHVADVLRGVTGVPESFGAGTEVLPIGMSPDFAVFLPHGEDVTHRFG